MFISSWRRYCKRARDITDSIDVLGHFWHATSLYPSLGFRFDRGAGQATGVIPSARRTRTELRSLRPVPELYFENPFQSGPENLFLHFGGPPEKLFCRI